ncbi:zinc transport system substrate-binding protein [Rhodothalassium salexigens DSM 2132]|uniref:High-affinity zinc uptake system protein ZnuA n=2 Tax=Rhodothalassium salexigens TaxID=1086 RepID=A0A4R2PLK4_RHOSA|nr:hypothetical protein [Rhodothalassium salexigens DSM 2132]TCP36493.1 zinc transport system substrate-binding protein [Rhodothalassium salexigens DSM 2132]
MVVRFFLTRRAALLGLGALALAPVCARAQVRPTVFVSIRPQKSFVDRIAGDFVQVEVMVPPGASPATYEPSPRQMLALADAVAWFRIGVPFEKTWAPRIAANHPQLEIVDTRQSIAFPPAPANGGKRNPHIWLSPRLVQRQSESIRDALSNLFPEQAQQFAAGQAAFAADLAALDAELTSRFAGVQNRRFMIYHPALYYFAQDYELEQIAIEADGQEPGPASLARIIEAARAADIHVIFVQQEFSQSAAQAVAREIDGEVVTLAPLAENMLENTRDIADALLRAMK